MSRPASYSYPPLATTAPQKQYPMAHSTSSAFSASANPNEDWTKISDLAERRRIQNRIAQRNYRKKLKKRLEDLERRAGSSSASPEQSHEELHEAQPSPTFPASSQAQPSTEVSTQIDPPAEAFHQQYVLPGEDRGMFTHQFTRQLSTSPPPLSYTPVSSIHGLGYTTYSQPASYCGVQSSPVADASFYPPSLSAMPPMFSYATAVAPTGLKQEYVPDDEMSPFSMSYAHMAGVNMSTEPRYPDYVAYVSTPPSTPYPPQPRYHYHPRPTAGG